MAPELVKQLALLAAAERLDMRQPALEAALRDPPVRHDARNRGVEQRQPGELPGGAQLAVERRGRGRGEHQPVVQVYERQRDLAEGLDRGGAGGVAARDHRTARVTPENRPPNRHG